MEEKNETNSADRPDEGEKPDWEAPTLLVEDVGTVTQGGTTGDVNPVDDAWYS
jgi:hypothetical protein